MKNQTIELMLGEVDNLYPEIKDIPAEKYIEQAIVGTVLAKFILAKTKPKKELKEAKKQLVASAKRLEELRGEISKSVGKLGYEAAPKHLWSVIQLIQQSQHVYTAAGKTKYDDEIFNSVAVFLRGVPNVWEIAKTIDELAEQKRKLSGQIVNNKA